MVTARPLSSAVNPGTGQPWRCLADADRHACMGNATVVVGAEPCCTAGALVLIAEQEADQARRERWAVENADLLRREAAAEQAWERRANQ